MLFWIKLYLAQNRISFFLTILFLSSYPLFAYSPFLFSSSSLFFSASYQSCLALVKSLSYLTSSKRFMPFHELTVPLKLFFLQALRNHFCCSEALSCLPNFSSLTTRSWVFVNPLSIDLHDWRICTGSKIFDLLNRIHVIRRCLTVLDTQVFFAGFDNLLRPSQLTRCGSTNLKIEFSNFFPVKHSVKIRDLIDIHFVEFIDFCDCFYGIQPQKVIILLLCKMEEGNHSWSFPVGWIFV